jgi:hypothetical protein
MAASAGPWRLLLMVCPARAALQALHIANEIGWLAGSGAVVGMAAGYLTK